MGHVIALCVVFVLVAVGAVAAWLFGTADQSTLLKRIQPINMRLLYVIGEYAKLDQDTYMDRRLWASIDGTRGLFRMWVNCGIFLTLARNFAENHPEEAAPEHRIMSANTLRLRMCLLLTLLEATAHYWQANLPWLYLRCSVQIYGEMVTTIGTLFDELQPEMSATLDEIF